MLEKHDGNKRIRLRRQLVVSVATIAVISRRSIIDTNEQITKRSAVEQARKGLMANSTWCQPPEEDPIDYTQCKNSVLVRMDIAGCGMTCYLNKILKVAMWAEREKSCFYFDEGRGVLNSGHSKLGYRSVAGQDTFIDPFLKRYFGQMGLEKSQFEEMFASGNYKVIDHNVDPIDNDWKLSWKELNDPRASILSNIVKSDHHNVTEWKPLKKRFLRRMFRIDPDVRDRACHRLASQGLNDEYMALSVRRGDKVTEAEILNTVDPYIKLAEEGTKSHFDGKVPTMFVATDDCSVMQEFREARPQWKFVSECDDASETNGFVYGEMKFWDEEQTDAHFHKFISELIGMASAKYWIGVASTSVSYWVYFMRPLLASDDTFVWADLPVELSGKDTPWVYAILHWMMNLDFDPFGKISRWNPSKFDRRKHPAVRGNR